MEVLVVLLLFAAATTAGSKHGRGYDCPFLDGIYISVMRRIFNPGLHKDLSTEVEIMWTTSILPENCRLVVEETIPRGMYVDVDQLRDLRDMEGLRTFVAANVDVEKPEFESEAFRVFVFRDLAIQENLRITSIQLPLHLRYHKPDGPSGFRPDGSSSPAAIVKLQNPRLLLACEGEEVAAKCPEKVTTSYCDPTGTTKCEYLNLPYKINVNGVEVSVPVGNAEHTPYVVGLTTFVVSAGTIYLMVALVRQVDPDRLCLGVDR